MNFIKINQSLSSVSVNIRFLTALHWLLSLTLPLLLIFLTSCVELEDENALPFGAEENVNNVSSALTAPVINLSPVNILKGEFVHIETNQSIAGGTKLVIKDSGITIIDRFENESSVQLTLAFEEIVYNLDGTYEQAIFEDSVYISKNQKNIGKLQSSSLSKPTNFQKMVQASAESFDLCDPISNPSVTYHNLIVTPKVQNVPDAVLGSSFCEDRDPCQINSVDVSFDQVFWDGDLGQKVKCEFTYSDEVPFLASQMKSCLTLIVPIEERNTLLTECSEVRNFKFGTL